VKIGREAGVMGLAKAANAGVTEFINCILEDEPNLDMTKASQTFLRDKMAKHYFGLTMRLRDRCLPALEEVSKALQKDPSLSEQAAVALQAYKDKVVTVAKASHEFVRTSQTHDDEERALHAIDKAAGDWESAPIPAVPAPFERFYACAVSGLSEMDGPDRLFRFFREKCIDGDARAFLTEVQRDCGVVLSGGEPRRTVSHDDLDAVRRLRGPAGFTKLLWGGCVKDAYKVWMAEVGGAAVIRSLLDLRVAATQLVAVAAAQPRP
jgi:hypothetical protein